MSNEDFDEQPLKKGHPQQIVEELGFFRIVDRYGNEKNSVFSSAKIVLTVGKQFNNRQKSGFGLNHIYYKHFPEIPSSFHIQNEEKIDKVATIVDFLKSFLNDKRFATEVEIFYEEDNKPILFKTKWGVVVINYNHLKNVYSVTTFSKHIKPKGQKLGFLG